MKNTLRALGLAFAVVGIAISASAQQTSREFKLPNTQITITALDQQGRELKLNPGGQTGLSVTAAGKWSGMYPNNKDKIKEKAGSLCQDNAKVGESCTLKDHVYNPNTYDLACYGRNQNNIPCQITARVDITCKCELTNNGSISKQALMLDPITDLGLTISAE
jgi:hypothetical protein